MHEATSATEVTSEPREQQRKERRQLYDLRRFDLRLTAEAANRWGDPRSVNGAAHRWFGLMNWLNLDGDLEDRVLSEGTDLAGQAWRDLLIAPVANMDDVALKLQALEQELIDKRGGLRDHTSEAVGMIRATCIGAPSPFKQEIGRAHV